MQGSDFHVPGKNFIAQPGGQVVGGGASVGAPGGRRPPLGGIQPLRQNTSLYPGINSNASTVLGSGIQTTIQGTSISSGQILHSTSQDMGKQTHLQTPPPQMSQVYAPNQTRPASQANYYTTARPQQSRNISHRSAQPGNQSQIVGIPGATNSQPTAMYPHSNIAIQPSVYVQGQVSGLQPNPHAQTVYSIGNPMSMQFSGPPQRHQTHQTQFPYQSYQPHALFTPSNIYGYSPGPQHHGFFYQQHNAQINIRGNATAVGNNNQHVPTSLNNTQGTALVTQNSLQQPQQPQQSQGMHAISLPISQTDMYSSFNTGNSNTSARSTKKIRTKAIKDIVNPITGRNISDEIYKDDISTPSGDLSNRGSPHTMDCNAEVVADFAARVAKLASESPKISPVLDLEDSINTITSQNTFDFQTLKVDSKHYKSPEKNDSISKEKKNESLKLDKGVSSENEAPCETTVSFKDSYDYSTSGNIKNDPVLLSSTSSLKEITSLEPEEKLISDAHKIITMDNKKVEPCSENATFFEKNMPKVVDYKTCENTIALHEQIKIEETHDNATLQPDKNLDSIVLKDDILPKSTDGKTMQKQKSKNKVKSKEQNRKVIEKDVSDMNIPIEQAQDTTSLFKNKVCQDVSSKDVDKEEYAEHLKDIKDKDNYESKKEHNILDFNNQIVEDSISDAREVKQKSPSIGSRISQINIKETTYENTSTEMTINKDSDNFTTCRNKIEEAPLISIVALKNDENNIVSGLSNTSKNDDFCSETVDLISTTTISATKSTLSLKYTYSDDQWSPINTSGKKVYDRDFLMKLQDDPNSKVKPRNLPDLDVVLNSTKTRNPVDPKLKEVHPNRHDSLFPGFAKTPPNVKVPPLPKKNPPGKIKVAKPSGLIHVTLSLREDVKLRETENAWKPTRLLPSSVSKEQTKTEALYKRVRSVLNKLTPQKFDTLVNQVRELQIDTQERLQGVIDLVFEKAVDEPNFSKAYALMCKELSNMQVTNGDSKDTNFRKLILTRCQTEFEKDNVYEHIQSEKVREIEECSDPEKKQELQMNLDEEKRKMRIKSVGNIIFVGELFKQNMLTCKIMHQCIQHLLLQNDEENLESLCKLLTTIGKALESKGVDLSDPFKAMQLIADSKGKFSSRIRFMIRDVIDLRINKWVPRRDDSNPKTIDQIQKEAESERLDVQLNYTSSSTPRKDDRGNDRKRNRGGSGAIEDGWSHIVGRTRQVYSVETSKLKNKPPSMDDMQLGSRSTYQWAKPNPKMTTSNKFSPLVNVPAESDKKVPTHLSGSRSTTSRDGGGGDRNLYHDNRSSRTNSCQSNSNNLVTEISLDKTLPTTTSNVTSQSTVISSQLSDDEFLSIFKRFLEEYISGEEDIEEAIKFFKESFPVSSHVTFVHEIINAVLEKSEHHQNKTSQLLRHLLSNKCLSLQDLKNGIEKLLEESGDLIIDIPKLWKYFAKILVHPIISNEFPLAEIRECIQCLPLKLLTDGRAADLIADLLSEMNDTKGSAWVMDTWSKSNLKWSDFSDSSTKINSVIAEHRLEFLKDGQSLTKECSGSNLDIDNFQDKLLPYLKDNEFDEICSWIQVNLGDKIKEPRFVRILMTAILESSVEQCSNEWIFKTENFNKLQKLIQRYVDADDFLELQCLFAVQAYITKLHHPSGLIVKIMNHLLENNVVSNEAFLAWEKNTNPTENDGKTQALGSLKSFFTLLKEVEDGSSGEEA